MAQLLERNFYVIDQPRVCLNEFGNPRAIGEADACSACRSAEIFHVCLFVKTCSPWGGTVSANGHLLHDAGHVAMRYNSKLVV